MRWVKDKPNDTGWYWFRHSGGRVQLAVEIERRDGALVCDIPDVNFHGDLARFEEKLDAYNQMRGRCDLSWAINPEWSDERLPIPC